VLGQAEFKPELLYAIRRWKEHYITMGNKVYINIT
jgi:hypothetical protein